MKKNCIPSCWILALAVIAITFGCKDADYPESTIAVTGLSLDMVGITLPINGEKTITAEIEPKDATNMRVTWSSDSHNVASVDQFGTVTALSEGTAIITAVSSNKNIRKSCIVSVMGPYQGNTGEPFMHMVKIDGGIFRMGSLLHEADRREDENMRSNPDVTLSTFWMGKYEVTQNQYQTVMGNNPSIFKGKLLPKEVTTGDDLPAENVSWYEAMVFCNKLSIMEGLTPVYYIPYYSSSDPGRWGAIPSNNNARWNAAAIIPGANGYRLPTEAQWEYACRAGTTTIYWTGDTELSLTGKANVADMACLEIDIYAYWNTIRNWVVINIYDGFSEMAPVGSFAPNAWGLYDMLGNVSEWCWDWYTESYNEAGGNLDPQGAATGECRVFRGGSWGGYGFYLRTAYRVYTLPYHKGDVIGFRVVRNYE